MREVVDFGIPGAIGGANICVVPGHGSKIYMNGVPTCLRCQAAEAKASAQPAGVVTIGDPGEEAMLGLRTAPAQAIPAVAQAKQHTSRVVGGDPITCALEAMRQVPAPRDIKSFKKIQKITALLEELAGASEEK